MHKIIFSNDTGGWWIGPTGQVYPIDSTVDIIHWVWLRNHKDVAQQYLSKQDMELLENGEYEKPVENFIKQGWTQVRGWYNGVFVVILSDGSDFNATQKFLASKVNDNQNVEIRDTDLAYNNYFIVKAGDIKKYGLEDVIQMYSEGETEFVVGSNKKSEQYEYYIKSIEDSGFFSKVNIPYQTNGVAYETYIEFFDAKNIKIEAWIYFYIYFNGIIKTWSPTIYVNIEPLNEWQKKLISWVSKYDVEKINEPIFDDLMDILKDFNNENANDRLEGSDSSLSVDS